MTRRLALGSIAAVVGSALAILGVRMPWYVVHSRGRSVSISGLGETLIEKVPRNITGADVASWSTPVAVLMLVAALLALLVGPRSRRIALAVVVAGAPILFYVWLALGDQAALDALPSSAGEAITAWVTRGIGTLLMAFGALIAAVGAWWAWPDAGRIARIGMPEPVAPGSVEPAARDLGA